MQDLNRREFLAMAAVLPPLVQASQPAQTNRIGTTSMFVSMHEASSARYDFKTAMEGYAKAGIKGVEPDLAKVREFAMKESPAAARRLLDDLVHMRVQERWRQHAVMRLRRREILDGPAEPG